jgi:hypothetical protein
VRHGFEQCAFDHAKLGQLLSLPASHAEIEKSADVGVALEFVLFSTLGELQEWHG